MLFTNVSSKPIKQDEALEEAGSVIDKLDRTDADGRAKIGKTRAKFLQLKNIWTSKELTADQDKAIQLKH